jgi:hypothetical protein
VSFPDDDPALMARLITYLYTGDFPRVNLNDGEAVIHQGQFSDLNDPFKNCGHLLELELYVKMYCLADKYLCPDLKELARSYYCETLLNYAKHIETTNQHISGVIFTSGLISTVYGADTPHNDRDLKDPLLVLVLTDVRQTKYVSPAQHSQMVVQSPRNFIFDLLMRPLRNGHWFCGKCNKNVEILDGYCVCGQMSCDKRQCWTEDMKDAQCAQCGFRGFVSDGYSDW